VVVFRDERSAEYPRYSKRAIDNYRAMGLGDSMIEYLDTIYGLDPEWCELFMQYTRAGLYTREVVSQATREICACATLAALDKQAQLKQHLVSVKSEDAATLLHEAEDAVRGNLQARAAAIAERYSQLGHDPHGMFNLMLKYAVSEDGSLHAEKFFRTTSDEFANTRAAFRSRQLVALARVTASECGRPAAGMAEAREMLKV